MKGNFAGAPNLRIFGKQHHTTTLRIPLSTLTRSAWAQYCIVQFCIRSAHGRRDHDITIWNISIIAYDRCEKVRSVKWRKSNKNYLRHKNSIKTVSNRTRDTDVPMYVTKRKGCLLGILIKKLKKRKLLVTLQQHAYSLKNTTTTTTI